MATSVAQQRQSTHHQSSGEELHPALEWIKAKQRPLSYILGAVLLAGAVGWYLIESGRRKQTQAVEALDRARAAIDAGSYPEASTELQRITRVFSGTSAAFDAVLALNQVRMLSGQSQLAIDELRQFIERGPPQRYQALAQGHLGMALENTGQFAEATTAYLAAAAQDQPAYVQIDALLNAARCQKLTGDGQSAAETLEDIISRFPETSPGVVEAKVRLAEITGGRV